ncbi:hypothetical protein L917_03033 [Phytophthora nicotianae]|uniref:Myb-like domain-containing protein n=1 Tax=Phytophthora nicotianae TaxID=4792 RepID=W2LU45_PHYNI|nr:hypothetical protein L917_03033 [Phytophthora nicotianae]
MISKRVHNELMAVQRVLHYLPVSPCTEYGWTPHERQLFWMALDQYPRGPWTAIAEFIGTKSTRQAMTHGQKLRQKLKRWGTRLHRNPTARSLMGGVPLTSRSSATVVTGTNVAISSPLSLAMAPPTPSGLGPPPALTQSPPSRSYTLTTQGEARSMLEDEGRSLQHKTERFVGNNCSSSRAMHVQGNPTNAVVSGSSEFDSLSMSYKPHTTETGPVLPADASIYFGETKSDEDTVAARPISEPVMPARNLLDELVDTLWSDHLGETK